MILLKKNHCVLSCSISIKTILIINCFFLFLDFKLTEPKIFQSHKSDLQRQIQMSYLQSQNIDENSWLNVVEEKKSWSSQYCQIISAKGLLYLCRGGYFLLPNREQPSPRSLISVKRCAVQKQEGISKNNGQMSCKFGEIIKKLYSL